MKTLLINGSPRRGNTRFALETIKGFLEGDVEYIDITKKHLEGCTACNVCRSQQPGKCILKDDTNGLLEKIKEADYVIFGTPVYFWGISAQLKVFIDKLYADVDGLRGSTKIGMIAIGAAQLTGPQYDIIDRQFKCISDFMQWDYDFYLPISASEPEDLRSNPKDVEKVMELKRKII